MASFVSLMAAVLPGVRCLCAILCCISMLQKPGTRSAFLRGRGISAVPSAMPLVVTIGCKKVVASVRTKAVSKIKWTGLTSCLE